MELTSIESWKGSIAATLFEALNPLRMQFTQVAWASTRIGELCSEKEYEREMIFSAALLQWHA